MDPLSLGGFGLAVTSLSFELFAAWIKGYNLILEARNMPKTCSYLLVRLRVEKEKVLGWAILAKISEDNKEQTGPELKLNEHTVIETLRQIQLLLLDFARLEKQYSLALFPEQTEQYQGTITNSDAMEPVQPEYTLIQQKALGSIDAEIS